MHVDLGVKGPAAARDASRLFSQYALRDDQRAETGVASPRHMDPLLLLPFLFIFILLPPPPITQQNLAAFHARQAVPTDITPFLVLQCEATRKRRRAAVRGRPRPEIGGQRITSHWLSSLKERDAKWRFRYA